MRRFLLSVFFILSSPLLFLQVKAQNTQTVTGGNSTNPINFTGFSCAYSWTNDKPSINLPASGDGNIPSFIATNTTGNTITANIKATPKYAGLAYITNEGANNVSIINTSTFTKVGSVDVGSLPIGITLNADGSKAYVVNNASGTVSVINTATNTILVPPIKVGQHPIAAVLSPDGSTLYVSNNSSNTVSIISTATNQVTSSFTAPSADGLTVSHDGSKVYVSNNTGLLLTVFNVGINTTSTLTTTSPTTAVLLSPDDQYIYAESFVASNVSVIDATTGSLVNTYNTGMQPWGMAISPDGSHLYTANQGSGNVSIINLLPQQLPPVTNVTAGLNPYGLSISADGSLVYVVNTGSNSLTTINTATNAVTTYPESSFVSPAGVGSFLSGCPPVTYTITVNSSSAPTIVAPSTAVGYISGCVGTPSESPQIQQFGVSGTGLLADVFASAPPNVEISLSPTGGYSNKLTIHETGGTISHQVVYARSAASAPVGTLTGNIQLSTAGTGAHVGVFGTINALPVVNPITPLSYNNGDVTSLIQFTGTANTFTWLNKNSNIGLASAGTAGIAPFTATNYGTTPITATISVTPKASAIAYIANFSTNNVTVINTGDYSSVTTVDVGAAPVGEAVSPDGSTVYIANSNGNTISVIDTKTNTVTHTIPVTGGVEDITLSPDGSILYAPIFNQNKVLVIDTKTGAVITPIAVGNNPETVTLSPDGSILYVVNYTDNTISVINAANNTFIKNITVDTRPTVAVAGLDGSRLYVTNQGGNSVSVINTVTNSVLTTIGVGVSPQNAALSPDGTLLYVTNKTSGTLSVISTSTNTVVKNVPVGSNITAVEVSFDGSQIFVGSQGDDKLYVIDAATYAIAHIITLPGDPIATGNFIAGGMGCEGLPISFNITVNPTSIGPAITAGNVLGDNIACVGTPSDEPDIQQVTISGNSLTDNIVATTSAGFEISLSPTGTYTTTLTLVPANGTVNNTTIFIRLAASGTVGNLSGNLKLVSHGAERDLPIAGVVNALPSVDNVLTQGVVSGTQTAAVNFTGTAYAYSWTNDTPSIGLAASGLGNIPAFTTVNTGTAKVTATIIVTPEPSVGNAYVSNSASQSISVINTVTNIKTSTITLPTSSDPQDVYVSHDGSHIYLSDPIANTVTVISTTSNAVEAIIPVPKGAFSIVVSPDDSKVYLVNLNADLTTNDISVISTASNTITATIPLGISAEGLAVTTDGVYLYVTNNKASSILVVNAATGQQLVQMTVGPGPEQIVMTPDGKKAYVTCSGNNMVYDININTFTPEAFIPVGQAPEGIAVSPDGSTVYVTNYTDGTVTAINVADNTKKYTVDAGAFPVGISVTPDNKEVFVANSNSGTVTILNAANGAKVTTVTVGTNPFSLGNFMAKGNTCTGTSKSFKIIVAAATPATVTTSGNISPLTTVYGTPSSPSRFTVSGVNLTAGILITPPAGFEVSTDGVNYTKTVTVGSTGTLAPATIYIRLAATANVGTYSGNVVLSTANSANTNVPAAVSNITPAALTITANSVNKTYGDVLTGGDGSTAFTATGLQNNETIGSVTITYGVGADASATVSTYTGSVAASAPVDGTFKLSNYTVSYNKGDITIAPAALTITANNQRKIYGEDNPPLTLTYSGFVNNENALALSPQPAIFTTATTTSPIGTYPITVNNAGSADYTITYVPGILTISPTDALLLIPNTFTPNGDGTNDTWQIKYIENYPNCIVNIYNRYGSKIFNSIGYGIAWDGKYKGTDVPSGTYYYVIDSKSGGKLISGWVAIVR